MSAGSCSSRSSTCCSGRRCSRSCSIRMHRRILERTTKPALAAAVSTLLVVLLILLPVTFITVAVVRELSGAATASRRPTTRGELDAARRRLAARARRAVHRHRPRAGARVHRRAHADLGHGARRQHPRRRRRRRRRDRADAAGRVHAVLLLPRRRPHPAGGLRDGAAAARAVAGHHHPHAGGDRRHRLRRARDLGDPGRARHVHLLDRSACRRRCSGAW